MRAILFALADSTPLLPITEHVPPCLLRVVDKPILIQIIEMLAHRQVTHVDLVLHDRPELIEEVVEDGKRWGVVITTHLIKELSKPFISVRASVKGWTEDLVLIGRAESLPNLPDEVEDAEQLFVDEGGNWTGWAFLRRETVWHLPADLAFCELPQALSRGMSKVSVGELLSCTSFAGWLESNQRVMAEHTDPLWFPATARQQSPGVWISQGSEVHATAELVAPVFIGKDSQIAAGCRVGPGVVVENHCLVDADTQLDHTLICHDSYVGQSLSLSHSIVNRNVLLSIQLGTTLEMADDFILSRLTPASPARKLCWMVERMVAAVLLFLLSPLLLAHILRRPVEFSDVVKLPGDGTTTLPWIQLDEHRHSKTPQPLLQRVSVLYHIVLGDAHFVGVAPRSVEEVAAMPSDWRKLYCGAKLGWLTLGHFHREPLTADDVYSSEAFYAGHASPWFDLKTFCRYLFRL